MKVLGVPLAALVLGLAACNGSVTIETDESGGGGATGTATGGSDTGTAGAGGATATSTVCVPEEPDWNDPTFTEPTCETLAGLTLTTPMLDAPGGGALSPGEQAGLTVQLVELTGKGFYSYPLVTFSSDVPGVTVSNEAMLYGIGPCDSYPMSTLVTVDASVPKGTVVTIGAQVGMLGMECPDAFALAIPVLVN